MKAPHELLGQLHAQLGQWVPDLAKAAKDDVEQHARAVVMSVLNRLDLVSREEFEAQAAVLRHTRERLEALERQVAALEGRLPSA